MENNMSGKQAVVLGGSAAGLRAARVLSEHFDKVLLIERERFAAKPYARALPNVQFVQQAEAISLLTSKDHKRVTGVMIHLLLAEAPAVQLDADLVVDARAHESQARKGLTQLGYLSNGEKIEQLPEGFIIAGDAANRFNRASAQMNRLSAIKGLIVERMGKVKSAYEQRSDFGLRFFGKLSKAVDLN